MYKIIFLNILHYNINHLNKNLKNNPFKSFWHFLFIIHLNNTINTYKHLIKNKYSKMLFFIKKIKKKELEILYKEQNN